MKNHIISFLLFTVFCSVNLFCQQNGRNYIITRTLLSEDESKYIDEINYFDGLGREVESIYKNFTPGKSSFISFKEYDERGNLHREWQPVASNSLGEFWEYDLIDFEAKAQYSDEYPYTINTYEPSPLNRTQSKIGPGEEWHKGNHSVEYHYGLNSSIGENSCRLFILNQDGSISSSGNHPEGSLETEIIFDENGNSTTKFKDTFGRTLLIRKSVSEGLSADTYFIYDDFNNLRYVLPPQLSTKLIGNKTWDSNDNDIWNFAYIYNYNSRGQCIEKKLPGCEPIYIRYDKGGHPILYQDGNQRNQNMWTINFPDKFGRTVISGLIKNINTKLFETSFLTATFRGDSDINGGYEFSFQLPDNIQFLTINYYDNYSFLQLLPESEEKKYANYNKTGYGQTELNASGLLTGRRIYTTTQPYSHNIEVNYYDKQGRLVEKHTSNHLGGMEDNFIAYTFSGKPLQTLHIHTAFDKSPVSEIYRYEYDHAERPTKTFYKLNDFDEILLSEQSYDELCRLARKKINNGNYAIDYNYNIRNWKEQISSSLFSETINYTKSTNGNNSYNGNISNIETTVRSATNISLTTKWNITYQYDGLNRLISSNYTPSGNPIQPYRADYSTSYTYDLNGNITSLTRKGPRIMLQENGSPIFVDYGDIDKLTLTLDGNHLQCVADEEGEIVFGNVFDFNDKYNDEIEYSYDSNGNLTSDLNREIELITYDSSNQPASISFKNGASTIYSYNADKQKLRTVYNTPQAAIAPTTENDTIFKPQNSNIQSNINSPQFYRDYCGNIIYKDGKLERILTECGYIEPNGQNGLFKFRYFLHDHLGNIRTVIDEQNTVLECNHYYPFGTPQGSSLNSQPYKFGGKELDRMNGLDIYDFEARQYDSLLGRFTTIDPLCEKYYDISPYAYCAGNPILYTDPTGEKITIAGVEYTPNMEYSGINNFIKNTINALQYVYKNGGEKVVNNLVAAENTYNFVKNNTRDKSFTTPADNSNDIEINMRTENVDIKDYYNAVSHELFHGIQYFHGQGGASIFNEVEAYLFTAFVSLYYVSGSLAGGANYSFPSPEPETQEEIIFSNAVNKLKNKFSEKDMNIAIEHFKKGAPQNNTGIYDGYVLRKANQRSSLMPLYFDFNNIK